jgi:hypothetical protein
VKQGFSEVIGSWNTMAMSRPISCGAGARAAVPASSWPSKAMRSALTRAVQGSRPMMASMATDLPEPDSPTMASTSLGSHTESTPSTAQ